MKINSLSTDAGGKFCRSQNISGAKQQNGTAAFFLKTEKGKRLLFVWRNLRHDLHTEHTVGLVSRAMELNPNFYRREIE